MFRPQLAALRCPNCGFENRVPVLTIIDVGQTPELKQVVLAGQLNASQCTNCRAVSYVTAPLLYHDPAHEFLGVFIPSQLQMTEPQRQKAIGDLSKALMDAIPAEQRRYYMLNPQQFLSMDRLVETLLGFEGITPEMIAASRKKVDLIERFVRIKDDSLAFNLEVKENEKLLDNEFFMMLGNFIASAQQQGARSQFDALSALREKLLPLTDVGRRALKQREAVTALGQQPTREALLQAIVKGDLDEVEAIAVVARPLLDYAFFEALTAQVEAAQGEERAALTAKRERILAITQELGAAEREALHSAGQIIQEMLGAENMEQAVNDMLPYINEDVMNLLLININNAEERKAVAAAARLKELWNLIATAMERSMPPEMRLLYQLADASYPEETRQILQEHKAEITPAFLDILQKSIESTEAEGPDDPERAAAVRHLRNVLTQARLGG